ncbi:hypothetical protein Trydic_g4126 [Trypoxylus dichotomus]
MYWVLITQGRNTFLKFPINTVSFIITTDIEAKVKALIDCDEYQQQILRLRKQNIKYGHLNGSTTLDEVPETHKTPGSTRDSPHGLHQEEKLPNISSRNGQQKRRRSEGGKR